VRQSAQIVIVIAAHVPQTSASRGKESKIRQQRTLASHKCLATFCPVAQLTSGSKCEQPFGAVYCGGNVSEHKLEDVMHDVLGSAATIYTIGIFDGRRSGPARSCAARTGGNVVVIYAGRLPTSSRWKYSPGERLVAYYVLYFLNLESSWGCPAVGSVLEVQLRALQPG
jgi:hypothetical protein